MIEFVKNHNCVCDCEHDKHGDPIQELWRFTANYYTSLLSKLKNHINNDNVHITKEEKDTWNNKASKESVSSLEETVKQIKSKLDNIEPSLLNDIKTWVESKSYVTHDELISYVADYTNKIISGEIELTGYAKKSWVLEQIKNITAPGGELDLSKYALKSDINDLISRISSLESRVSDIENNGVGKNYEITNVSVDGNTLTITQNNMGSKSVVLPSDGGGSTTPGLTEDDVNAMLSNAKTLIVTKNKEFFKSYNPFNSPEDITIDIVGSGGGSGEDNKYYQAFFQNKNSNTIAPAIPDTGKGPNDYLPTDEKSKWSTNAENPSKDYYTWMTFAFVSNGVYGSWINPVCITGKDGEAGTDITDKEQIYKLAGEGENVEKPTQNIKDQDDFVPRDEGWTDNPSGVSATVPCEWTCIRTKNTETNKWSDWTKAVLWSHYGHNGTDGDGVEYIYWAGHNDQAFPLSQPNTWYTDEQSKANGFRDGGSYSEEDGSDGYCNSKYYNKREFILSGTGWSDNPADLSSSYYGPGSRQYVSIRRKYSDNVSSSSYWHKYSAPTLWSYYAQNGDAGKGVSLNLDNGTMAVSLNSDETNQLFDQTCTARFYNGTNTANIDTLEYSVIDANGGTVSTDGDFSITISQNAQDSNCKDVSVHISKGKFNFTNGGYTIKLTAKASINGEITTRYATIQLLGVNFGEDGISYKLSLSSSIIKLSKGSYYPNTIDVFVSKIKGAESIQQITPTQAITNNNKWSFKYSIDSASEQPLIQDAISQSLISSATNTIRVSAYFGNVLVDQQTAVIVKDGIDGQNGVSYSVDVFYNTVTGKYKDDGSISYSGSVKFYVTKIISNTSSKHLKNSDVLVKCYPGGISTTSNVIFPNFQEVSSVWELSITDCKYAFVNIAVNEKPSNTFYASVVVPFSTPGKNGQDAAPQTIKGSPLRMRGTWAPKTEYFDGTVATTDGTMYQDVVMYDNLYYVCVNHDGLKANNWTQAPNSTEYWQKMAVTESFVTDKILANQGYIKELSSEEIVITDGGDDNKKIVAGMTSSKSLKNSSLPLTVTKGNIRMWAGQFSNANLSTAPFTVSDTGHVKMNDCEIYGFTKRKKLVITESNFDDYFTQIQDTGGAWLYELNLDKSGTFIEIDSGVLSDGSVLLPCFDTESTDNHITFDEACEYIGQYFVIKNASNESITINGVFNQTYSENNKDTARPGSVSVDNNWMIIAKCAPRISYVDSPSSANPTKWWVEIGWEYSIGAFGIN